MVAPTRLGDPTSHGGAVQTAQSQPNLMGKAIACVGDNAVVRCRGMATA